MDFTWVRSLQPGGGKSRWHLFTEHRRGPFYRNDRPTVFALTACGEGYLEPIEMEPGTQDDPWNPGVLLPATLKLRYADGQMCHTCRLTAWRVVHSQPI